MKIDWCLGSIATPCHGYRCFEKKKVRVLRYIHDLPPSPSKQCWSGRDAQRSCPNKNSLFHPKPGTLANTTLPNIVWRGRGGAGKTCSFLNDTCGSTNFGDRPARRQTVQNCTSTGSRNVASTIASARAFCLASTLLALRGFAPSVLLAVLLAHVFLVFLAHLLVLHCFGRAQFY